MKDHYGPYFTDEDTECLFGQIHTVKKWKNQDQTHFSDMVVSLHYMIPP